MSAQQAPNFTLENITGSSVSLSDYRGRMVVILFGGKNSADQARQIARTIGQRYQADQLPILGVLDMRGVPRLVQALAKGDVTKAHREAVADAAADFQTSGRQAPANLSQLIVMAPDWQGKVVDSYGVSGVDRQAVAVLVDGDGNIRGYGAGMQGGEQILSLFG